MQGSELACCIGRIGDQRQSKVNVANVQTFLICLTPVQTCKYVNAIAPNGQQIGTVNGGTIGQGDCANGLGQSQVAIDLEETEHVQRQVTVGLERLSLAAQHVQLERAAGASGHCQVGGSVGVIDYGGVAGGLVDGHIQVSA